MLSFSNKNKPKNKKQLWALCLAAPLFQVNSFKHEYLYGAKTKAQMKEQCSFLKRDWGIYNSHDLKETLEGLRKSKPTDEFRQRQSVLLTLSEQSCKRFIASYQYDQETYESWKLVDYYKFTLNNAGIAAWDIQRYVFLCRIGAANDLIDDNEAWDRILEMAPIAQNKFSSWQEYVLSYFAARQIWLGNSTVKFANQMRHDIKGLLTDKDGILNGMDWNVQLD